MAARCASCSYPLSVSDSVRCCECSSYFHIDCAQLVGFPYYELSSDPLRNTFHCQTCKLLPLPRSDSFSDSDSDDAMPSRQLGYPENQQDFAKEMNEIKGTVQDLSELCKDMFREISELKSVNLTLRCCVENLRHDGEKQNEIILDLKKRIEALEGKKDVKIFKPIEINSRFTDGISSEKEDDTERYLTPDPEYSRLRESEEVNQGTVKKEVIHPLDSNDQYKNKYEFSNETYTTENMKENKDLKNWESPDSTTYSEHQDLDESKDYESSGRTVHFAEEENIYSTNKGDNTEARGVRSVENWSWRGNKAIHLSRENDSSEEEEKAENDTTDIEDTDDQGWEVLEEDVQSGLKNKEEAYEYDGYYEDSEKFVDERRVTWVDNLEKSDQAEEPEIFNEDNSEQMLDNTEETVANYQKEVGSQPSFEEEETDVINEDETERGERLSLQEEEEEDVDKPKVEELDRESEIVDAAVEVEDYIKAIYTGTEGSRLDEGVRLEGETVVEDGATPEGVEGGQSPDQGEVQPSATPEGSEPPPPQPQHSPDDLWDYLKESVSGEHPATVEEFVQKLIGTLEHVPEEYLKPVIDYNIKRATSPSVTDGEHLETKDEGRNTQGESQAEEILESKAHPQEGGDLLVEGEDHVGDTSPAKEMTTSLHDDTDFPEEPSESAEGYYALQES